VLTMEDYVGRREAKGMQITLDILDRRSEFPNESYEKTAEAVLVLTSKVMVQSRLVLSAA
jgi:hypothetical protein